MENNNEKKLHACTILLHVKVKETRKIYNKNMKNANEYSVFQNI